MILVAAACLSSVSTRGAKWHALFSGAFLLVAGVGVSIALLVVAPTLQPASWAVGHYNCTDLDASGLPSLAYMYLIGMLMGQATFIGAPPHQSSLACAYGRLLCELILCATLRHAHGSGYLNG